MRKQYHYYFRKRVGTSPESSAVTFDPTCLNVDSKGIDFQKIVTRLVKFTLLQQIIFCPRVPRGFYGIRQWIIGITFRKQHFHHLNGQIRTHGVMDRKQRSHTAPLVLSNLFACPHLHTPAEALRARLNAGPMMSPGWQKSVRLSQGEKKHLVCCVLERYTVFIGYFIISSWK